MGTLGNAASFLAQQLTGSASVKITYSRGAQSVVIQAIPGSSRLQVGTPATGLRIVRTDKDYLFKAALLVLGGSVTQPQRGDVASEVTADGVTRQYQVLPYADKEPMYRYSDPERTIIRVHFKATQGGA